MSPFRTLEEDRGAGRAVDALRLVGAVVVLGAAAWLVATTPTGRSVAAAILAVIVAGVWIAGFVRGRRAEGRTLALTPSGVEVAGRSIGWAEVRAIDVDEDRLVVRITRTEGEPVVIDALFRGLSVYAVADAIRAARAAAEPRRSGRQPPGAPDAPPA